MIRPRPGYMIVSLFAMNLTLSACTDTNTPVVTPMPNASSSPASSTPTAEPTESSSEAASSERASEASFEVMTADGYKPLTATLNQGDGFTLYVLEGFSFESSSGRLALKSKPDYFVDIERLPDDYDIAKLRIEGENDLMEFGTVSDYSGELVEHPLGFAELYLQVSSGEGIRDYIVWKSEDETSYLFRLRNPKVEDASEFANAIFVLLSTVR